MGVVKLYSVSFWMCDLKLDLADILLRAYYTYRGADKGGTY